MNRSDSSAAAESSNRFPLRGQEEARARIFQLIREDRQHGFLFLGPRGSGRRSLALEAARHLLCLAPDDGGACGHCSACRYFAAGTHPDFRLLDRGEDSIIKVDRVRSEILADLHILPQISARKVYVMIADDLNEQGQNALLKSLEEPPANARFLLTAERPETLLPTILSRLASIQLKPLSRDVIRSILQERGFIEVPDFILACSEGRPGKALDLAAREDMAELRQLCMEIIEEAGTADCLDLCAGAQRVLLDNKDQLSLIYDLSQSFIRDLALLVEAPELGARALQNGDFAPRLQKLAAAVRALGRKPLLDTEAADELLRSLRRGLDVNVNAELASWEFLLELGVLLGKKGGAA